MHAPVAGRKITAGRRHHRVLHLSFRAGKPYLCTDSIVIALGAPQVEADPVIPVPAFIAQQVGRTVEVANHDVDIAVVVKITESCAAGRPCLIKNVTGDCRDICEFTGCILQQQWRFERPQMRLRELDVIHHMPICYENLLFCVVVIIK